MLKTFWAFVFKQKSIKNQSIFCVGVLMYSIQWMFVHAEKTLHCQSADQWMNEALRCGLILETKKRNGELVPPRCVSCQTGLTWGPKHWKPNMQTTPSNHLLRMAMESKYYAEEVIGHPNHHLRIWLGCLGIGNGAIHHRLLKLNGRLLKLNGRLLQLNGPNNGGIPLFFFTTLTLHDYQVTLPENIANFCSFKHASVFLGVSCPFFEGMYTSKKVELWHKDSSTVVRGHYMTPISKQCIFRSVKSFKMAP